MGLLDKLFGGKKEESAEIDLDKLVGIEEEADAVNPPAKMYVKKVALRNEGDISLILKEINDGNLVIVDITYLSKQPKRLREMIMKLNWNAQKNNGDLAALGESYIIITPAGVKIIKSRK